MIQMVTQLPLSIHFNKNATFDTWLEGDNALATSLCQRVCASDDKQVLVWGGEGVGKSHLLQATCAHQVGSGNRAWYASMFDLFAFGLQSLQGLESLDLICLDDLHACAGLPDWEEALFGLINACRDHDCKLLFALNDAPQHVGFKLPDLISRLTWGVVIELKELDLENKKHWLKQQAALQRFDLPDAVLNYMLDHYPRSMTALNKMFEALSDETLIQQRKLTIPLVKEALSDHGEGLA